MLCFCDNESEVTESGKHVKLHNFECAVLVVSSIGNYIVQEYDCIQE